MFLTLFSILFLLLVSIAKIYLSNILPTEEYAAFTACLGLAALGGTAFYGAYPKLYPVEIKKTKVIKLDALSILSFVLLLIFGGVNFDNKFVYLMVCFILFYAMHESMSIIYSLFSNGKRLVLLEICHSFVFVLFIIFHIYYKVDISFVGLFLCISLLILFVILKLDGFSLKFHGSLKDLLFNGKYIIFVSAASVFLIPFLFYNFFDSSTASKVIAFFYIFSIPVAFNQVLINRIFYRIRPSLKKSTSYVLLIIIIQSIFFYWLNGTDYYIDLIGVITPYTVNLSVWSLFLFLFSRAIFSLVFIESRFRNSSLSYSFFIEFFKMILTVVSVWLVAIYAEDNEHLSMFFIFFSISYFLSTFLYLLSIKLNK